MDFSFFSKASNNIDGKLEKIVIDLKEVNNELIQNKKSLEKAMIGREDNETRHKLLQDVEILSKDLEKINHELEKYKDNDPDTLKSIDNTKQVSLNANSMMNSNLVNVDNTKGQFLNWISQVYTLLSELF